jgi:NADPH-dependent 2,4-dienoyl-CoA reductase/sulfur reductase-like enzyme
MNADKSSKPSALSRRRVLQWGAGSAAAAALTGCASVAPSAPPLGRVVVIGGGYGGATAAKYLRLWGEGRIEVTLVEPSRSFVSCPMSNLVLGGSKTLADITVSYDGLRQRGVNVVHDMAAAVDAAKKEVRLASGGTLKYDRLILSPGIDFMYENVAGMNAPDATTAIPHAWKAGPQTTLLRQQLQAMPDGGTVVISLPLAPYRCPPGPYERACQIAHYLKTSKPRSKLLLLDANPDMVSKKPLFTRVFAEDYKGIIEYRNGVVINEADPRGRSLKSEFGDTFRADVLNLIPPMRAGDIARQAGVINANNRWCTVDWLTMDSLAVPGVHVLGDATLSAPAMPKSGHMANQHGKTAAAAIVELMNGRTPQPTMMANTCYSYIDDKNAVHVSSVHRYVAERKTMETVAGSGGISNQERPTWAAEGGYAWGWAQTIWADMLT